MLINDVYDDGDNDDFHDDVEDNDDRGCDDDN